MKTLPETSIHPIDGRAARAERNHPRLNALRKDLADTERSIARVRILIDHPELGEPSDAWIAPERRLGALSHRRFVLRVDIEDIERRLRGGRS